MMNWATRCLNVLAAIIPKSSPVSNKIIEEFQTYGKPTPYAVRHLVGRRPTAVRDDFRDGFMDDIGIAIETTVEWEITWTGRAATSRRPAG